MRSATEVMTDPTPTERNIELAEFEAMLSEHERRFDATFAEAIECLEAARVTRAMASRPAREQPHAA